MIFNFHPDGRPALPSAPVLNAASRQPRRSPPGARVLPLFQIVRPTSGRVLPMPVSRFVHDPVAPVWCSSPEFCLFTGSSELCPPPAA